MKFHITHQFAGYSISKMLLIVIVTFTLFACSGNSNTKESHKHVGDTVINLVKFPPASKLSKEETQRIQDAASQWYDATLKNSNYNGGIIVAKGGNIIFEKYKGSVPLGGKDSVNRNTPFHIASVTKTFTAMAVLKLWEEGKIKLEDTYDHYFPEFNYPGVTIQSLLSHRSGLPNYLHAMSVCGVPETALLTNHSILNLLIENKNILPPTPKPDTRFAYNNTNYALLALLIEKVTGKTYPEYMRNTIFIPLQMEQTFVFTLADSATAPKNYDWRGREEKMDMFDGIYGDKNIYSTPRDLLKWDRALSKGLFLTKETLEKAYTPYSNEKPGIKNYGLGWRMDIFPNGKKLIFHNGWWHGNNATFIRLIPEDATIILLNNRFTRLTYQAKWLANIFDQYFTAPPVDEESTTDSTAKTITDSVGINQKNQVKKHRVKSK